MKRIFPMLLCLGLLLGLWGCGPEQPPAEPSAAPTEVPTEPPTPEDLPAAQVGAYVESRLMADVPGQRTPVLLRARSDGTVDYIFSTLDHPEEGVSSARQAEYQYYTIRPDGTATKQPADWIDQLDKATAAAYEASGGEDGWQFSFSAWEGNILIFAELKATTGASAKYAALYRLHEGELTQIPFQWADYPGDIYAIEEGAAVLLDPSAHIRRGGGALWGIVFSYDGTEKRIGSGDLIWEEPLGVGGSTLWYLCSSGGNVASFDLSGKNASGAFLEWDGAHIRCGAVSPEGSALYLLSNDYGKAQTRLRRFTKDGVEDVVQDTGAYLFGDTGTGPYFLAAANDGTLYTLTREGAGAVLRQYRRGAEGET